MKLRTKLQHCKRYSNEHLTLLEIIPSFSRLSLKLMPVLWRAPDIGGRYILFCTLTRVECGGYERFGFSIGGQF